MQLRDKTQPLIPKGSPQQALFLYETHLHTAEGSKCAKTRARDYVQRYLELGYQGIFVTDHFYRGNCAVDPQLPWDVWVDRFCVGFEAAQEEGLRLGLDVFFGWEERFDDDEYLIYGLDKTWLLNHPEVRDWSRAEQFEQVHRFGGCVIQAHPFRQRPYFSAIRLAVDRVDGVEVYNSGNAPNDNALAYRYAQGLAKPMVAGSDTHELKGCRADSLAATVFTRRLSSAADYAARIKSSGVDALRLPEISRAKADFFLIELPVFYMREGAEEQALTLDQLQRMMEKEP